MACLETVTGDMADAGRPVELVGDTSAVLPGLKRLDAHEGWLVRLLDWSFHHPRLMMTGASAGVIAAGAFAAQLPRAFLPPSTRAR